MIKNKMVFYLFFKIGSVEQKLADKLKSPESPVAYMFEKESKKSKRKKKKKEKKAKQRKKKLLLLKKQMMIIIMKIQLRRKTMKLTTKKMKVKLKKKITQINFNAR